MTCTYIHVPAIPIRFDRGEALRDRGGGGGGGEKRYKFRSIDRFLRPAPQPRVRLCHGNESTLNAGGGGGRSGRGREVVIDRVQ